MANHCLIRSASPHCCLSWLLPLFLVESLKFNFVENCVFHNSTSFNLFRVLQKKTRMEEHVAASGGDRLVSRRAKLASCPGRKLKSSQQMSPSKMWETAKNTKHKKRSKRYQITLSYMQALGQLLLPTTVRPSSVPIQNRIFFSFPFNGYGQGPFYAWLRWYFRVWGLIIDWTLLCFVSFKYTNTRTHTRAHTHIHIEFNGLIKPDWIVYSNVNDLAVWHGS